MSSETFPNGLKFNSFAQGMNLPYQSRSVNGNLFECKWKTDDSGFTWKTNFPDIQSVQQAPGNFLEVASAVFEYTVTAKRENCPECTDPPCRNAVPAHTGIDGSYNWWRSYSDDATCVFKEKKKSGDDPAPPGYRTVTKWRSDPSANSNLLQKVQDKINQSNNPGLVKSINVLGTTPLGQTGSRLGTVTTVQANVARQRQVVRTRPA